MVRAVALLLGWVFASAAPQAPAAPAAGAWQPLAAAGGAVQLLAARRDAVDRLLDAYDFPASGPAWRVSTLVSPWLRNYVLYRFDSAAGDGDRLALLLARVPGTGWPIALAPRRRRGQGDRAPQTDPYNYAAFNATVANERPLPATSAGWLQWAALYLDLIGCDDTPVAAERVHDDLSPRLSPATYGPQVFAEGGGWTGVQIYTLSAGGVREYGMEFNADGKLRNLLFQNGSRSQPPAPLRGAH